MLLSQYYFHIAFEPSSLFTDPPTMHETPGKMYALATVLTLLATLAVLLRFRARNVKSASIAWDDHLIVFALVDWVARLTHLQCRD